jgi:hypothetical protein
VNRVDGLQAWVDRAGAGGSVLKPAKLLTESVNRLLALQNMCSAGDAVLPCCNPRIMSIWKVFYSY